ncbi:MAG TPA: diacylglycerol kinase family protein [Thermoanaerobaculia bacterium]|nr:diacylglycerol kinase family protein [Thermoanaerobaculia bacterium]
MRTRVVVNPNAGSADDLGALREAVATLPEAEVCLTEEAGHAERLAREAVERGCELVVAAGGDGTLNEVVNGLAADFGGARLGLLPLGTGNDFARSIGVPADLAGALAVLAEGRDAALDVGRATVGAARWFVNVSAGGFSGLVNEKMDSAVKSAWGPLSYLRSAVEALPELAGYRTTIRLDGDETLEVSAYSVIVANARYVASGIPVAPEARLDDGLLDLMIVPEASVPQLAVLVPLVLLGRHLGNDLILFRRSGRLEIRSDPAMSFNVDGELLGDGPATFEVMPRALRVVVGEMPG